MSAFQLGTFMGTFRGAVVATAASMGLALSGCGKSAETESTGGPAQSGGLSAGEQAAAREMEALAKKKIPVAEFQAFADGYKVDGYTAPMPPSVSESGVRLHLKGPTRENGAGSKVTVAFHSCLDSACGTLSLAEHKGSIERARRNLPPVALSNPDLVFDLYEAKVGDVSAMGIYTLYMTAGAATPDGGVSRGSANDVTLRWTDDRHFIEVSARADDWNPKDQKELAERTPRAFLEGEAAKALKAALAGLKR
jgi:hypothetical protein